MSGMLSKASRLKPEIRLAQAVSQFEAELSDKQKADFGQVRLQARRNSPDTRDVMRFTAEIDRNISDRVGGRCFGPRFTNFLQCVQQFAALGDVVVGGSQNIIACGIWSLVRMSLMSIVNISSHLDKLSTLFMIIGRSAPRYQDMALLYPHSKRLGSYLAEYFIVTVQLCHSIVRFAKKSTFQRISASLSDLDLKGFQSELDIWASSIKEEVGLVMAKRIEEEAVKNSRFRVVSSLLSESFATRQRLATNLRVLDFCSTYDYETTWKQIRKIGNTRLFENETLYQEWKHQSTSCTLLYTGKLGSGKSVLLANVVDDLNISVQNSDVRIAYFFCRHDIPESLRALTVLGSLTRQLLHFASDLTAIGDLCDQFGPVIEYDGITKILQKALSPTSKAYIILDGVDECDASEREILIRELQKMQMMFSLHLCISFRVEPNDKIGMAFTNLADLHIASIPDDNPDIATFIKAELKDCLERQALTIGDPEIILEIQEALLKGSNGMFLWVALQIQCLCGMKTDQAIRDALVDLPRDLSETFSRILWKAEGLGKNYQQRILQIITVAIVPLTTDELREALSVIPGDTAWKPSILLNDVYATLACCGCLLTIDEEESTVRFIHHSVKQYLLRDSAHSDSVRFTEEQAQTTLANVILTYLNYGIFQSALSTNKVPRIMIRSTPSRVIDSTGTSLTAVRSLALKFLESGKQPDIDISKTLAEARIPDRSQSTHTSHFYNYATRYVARHLIFLPGVSSLMEKLLCNALRELKSKDTNMAHGDAQRLLWWAVEYGHEAVVQLFFEIGQREFDLDKKDVLTLLHLWARDNGRHSISQILSRNGPVMFEDRNGEEEEESNSALQMASAIGHIEFVKMMLGSDGNPKTREHIDLDTTNARGQTALHLAATHCHDEVVELLLVNGAGTSKPDDYGKTAFIRALGSNNTKVVSVFLRHGAHHDTIDEHGSTPLIWASRRCLPEMINLLTKQGRADVATVDKYGRNALFAACQNNRVQVIMSLFENGADATVTDKKGVTPLHIASEKGFIEVTTLLYNLGAKIEARDNQGRTPLMVASDSGHAETASLLLKLGSSLEIGDDRGYAPLHFASWRGHEHVVKTLLEKGAAFYSFYSYEGWTPLMMASERGHLAVVELLLRQKGEIDICNFRGITALMLAAGKGHLEIVKLLLGNGALMDLADHFGSTSLYWALENGHFAIAGHLFENGADLFKPVYTALKMGRHDILSFIFENEANRDSFNPDSVTIQGQNLLEIACSRGFTAGAEKLLEIGANPSLQNEKQQTPLFAAVMADRIEIVRLLIEKGAVAETVDRNGWTPLHVACNNGNIDIATLLLDQGVTPDTYVDGTSPLRSAFMNGCMQMVELLSGRGASLDVTDNDGMTPLNVASDKGDLAAVNLYLKRGADSSITNNEGLTPLHTAARRGRRDIVKALLDHGADPNLASEHDGRTPLFAATCNGDLEIVQLLLEKKVNLETFDQRGWSALKLAKVYDHLNIQTLLLDKGADVSAVEDMDDFLICIKCNKVFLGEHMFQNRQFHNVTYHSATGSKEPGQNECRVCAREFPKLNLCMDHEREKHTPQLIEIKGLKKKG